MQETSQPTTRADSGPPDGGLRRYLQRDLRPDAVAGLTVAVMGVPQAMAYALIAGLPPVYGLYTAITTCIVAALLGSSNHLVTGPTNALCMVLLSLTAHLPDKYPGITLIEAALLLTFMVGVIQIAFGLLRLGAVIRYVSHSVVIGFTAGAGILIALNQLKNILGIDISAAHADRSWEVLKETLIRLGDANPYALAIGIVTAVVVVFAPRIHPRLPGALIGILITGGMSYLLGWHDAALGSLKVDIVRDIEPIGGSLAGLHVPELIASPNYELTRELGVGALALAILGLIEAASISRAIATSSGQRLDFTREFVAQGASNVVGSFFFCFAASGSFTRSAVCFKSGGRTRMAAVFSAICTTIALLVLGPIADYIPKAALAGILIVIAYSMVDKKRLALSWRSGHSTRAVLVSTLVATLILPLEFAIFVGVFLSIVILLRTTGKTDLTQLVPRTDSGFDEVPFNRAGASPVVTVNMEGDLYFAAAEDLDYEMIRCITPETRVVVLRMKRLRAVGSTAMAMLEHFWQLLGKRGIRLVVCGIEDQLKNVLTRSGVRKQIGEANIFYADNKLFQSTELAMARAWSIVQMEQRVSTEKALKTQTLVQRHVTAGDLMQLRFLRFGNQHQLRESVWLLSELLKHTKSLSPEHLFLQDRDGKLFGELSPWRILRALGNGADSAASNELRDQAVGELLRKDFQKPIKQIADTDLERLDRNTTLARLLEVAVQKDIQVMPICDVDGRIKGLVNADDLLRGLKEALRRAEDQQAQADAAAETQVLNADPVDTGEGGAP